MATVIVTVTNNSGGTVGLTLDDEADAERIAYFQTLKRREDLADVDVKPAAAMHNTPKKSSGGTGDDS